uniref:Homologous-pairing protein 2 homolog n=1 Tax=Aplanochytrium stocchinoi TaxID=215587 RepID=A0A7S3PF49_9STRA
MNRPFGTTDLARKFKQDFSRSQINKALENLMKKELAQTNEKGSIYWVDQRVFGEVSDAIVKDLSVKVEKLSSEISELIARKQDIAVSLRQAHSEPKTCNLDTLTEQLQNQIKSHKDKVNAMEQAAASGKSGKGGQQNSETIVTEAKFYRKMWKDRRAIVEDIIDQIVDQKPKTKDIRNELYEDIGIDSDKSVNVSLNDIRL